MEASDWPREGMNRPIAAASQSVPSPLKLYHIVIFMLNLKLSKSKETFLLILKLIFGSQGMASILQNLFVRALNPESVRSLKIVISHASLYLGIILYTAVGAKVMVVVIDRSGNWTVLIWMVIVF